MEPEPSYSGFKQTLFEAEKINEIGNRSCLAYGLSWAGTKTSGWSYGWLQFDLSGKLEIGKNTLLDILKNAKWDSDGSGHKKGDNIIPDKKRVGVRSCKASFHPLAVLAITLLTSVLFQDLTPTPCF
jgi:hypothetical protein